MSTDCSDTFPFPVRMSSIDIDELEGSSSREVKVSSLHTFETSQAKKPGASLVTPPRNENAPLTPDHQTEAPSSGCPELSPEPLEPQVEPAPQAQGLAVLSGFFECVLSVFRTVVLIPFLFLHWC